MVLYLEKQGTPSTVVDLLNYLLLPGHCRTPDSGVVLRSTPDSSTTTVVPGTRSTGVLRVSVNSRKGQRTSNSSCSYLAHHGLWLMANGAVRRRIDTAKTLHRRH